MKKSMICDNIKTLWPYLTLIHWLKSLYEKMCVFPCMSSLGWVSEGVYLGLYVCVCVCAQEKYHCTIGILFFQSFWMFFLLWFSSPSFSAFDFLPHSPKPLISPPNSTIYIPAIPASYQWFSTCHMKKINARKRSFEWN